MAETKKATLGAALAKAQAEFPPIKRTKTVKVTTKTGGQYSFEYAPLDSILDAVRPVLGKHGLAVTQLLTSVDGAQALETRLLHESGDEIAGVFPLPVSSGGAQELGSLLTYIRRYALVAILGIASEEDDDGNGASGNKATSRGEYLPETRIEPQAKRPESWAALAAGFNVLDVDPEWLKQAVFYRFGKDRTELDSGEKELAFQMLAGVLMRLQDGEYGPPEMFGFSREQLQSAFAGPLDGQVLDGPPWCVGMENPENSGRLGKAAWLEAQTVPGEEDIPFGKEGEDG